jgi:hypothetical protein
MQQSRTYIIYRHSEISTQSWRLDSGCHVLEVSFRSCILSALALVTVDMLGLDLPNPEKSWVTIIVFRSVSASELESKASHWRSNNVNEGSKVAAFFVCYPDSEVRTLTGLSRVHDEVQGTVSRHSRVVSEDELHAADLNEEYALLVLVISIRWCCLLAELGRHFPVSPALCHTAALLTIDYVPVFSSYMCDARHLNWPLSRKPLLRSVCILVQ